VTASVRDTHIVQLPFPSVAAPHPRVAAYYKDYGRALAWRLDGYFVPEGALWELPLWAAHLSGMLESLGYEPNFLDLSTRRADAQTCAAALLNASQPGDRVLLSPLAQNFDLALEVSRRLLAANRLTILGGNMAGLAKAGEDVTTIHRGQATPSSLKACLETGNALVTHRIAPGAQANWLPSYRLLEPYRGKVPLLRLNASHGCLFACDFCGDAWSRSLTVVPVEVLEHEVRQFERLFPETRLIYVGDKTFGQSPQAVRNLLEVFARRPQQYRFIVQTHVLAIKDDLLEAMLRLGVVVVELGFESASRDLLRENRKTNLTADVFRRVVRRLDEAGLDVVLNVLSGLPEETPAAHVETLGFIHDAASEVWLYNLYNFVPYPLTPQFLRMRDRIVDWQFENWREDGPPVFRPWHLSRDESYRFFLQKVAAAHAVIRRQLSEISNGAPYDHAHASEPVP
jgi:hypothetical protein